MIQDGNGNVALVYFQTVPKRVEVHGTTYMFMVQRNINLAWVKPEHVDQVLRITKTCCGGSRKTVFRYATEQQERVWSGRSER